MRLMCSTFVSKMSATSLAEESAGPERGKSDKAASSELTGRATEAEASAMTRSTMRRADAPRMLGGVMLERSGSHEDADVDTEAHTDGSVPLENRAEPWSDELLVATALLTPFNTNCDAIIYPSVLGARSGKKNGQKNTV